MTLPSSPPTTNCRDEPWGTTAVDGADASGPSSRRPRPTVSLGRFFFLLSCASSFGGRGNSRPFPVPSASAFAPTTVARITRGSFRSGDGRRTLSHEPLHSIDGDDGDGDGDAGGATRRPHVVVLGGGFGGINTALTLSTLPWSDGGSVVKPKITLVDKSERFVFLPLLYELCVEDAGLDEVAPTFESLLDGGKGLAPFSGGLPDLSDALRQFSSERNGGEGEGGDGCEVSFVRARVEGIDAPNKRVVLSNPDDDGVRTVEYDALVIATGSEVALDAVPGASGRALPFYTVEQALELKRRLALLDARLEDDAAPKRPANVVVVGGGYSGVELALNLVERVGADGEDVRVTLVHRGKQVLDNATEHNRNTGLDRLKSAGVHVMTSTSVVEVLPRDEEGDAAAGEASVLDEWGCVLELSTKSDDGEGEATAALLPATLLLWTAGATPTSGRNAGVRNSVLPRDAMGRILTSPTLNVPEHPDVFAVGDCGRPRKQPYAGTAQVAIQQATVAAWNVYAALTYGKEDDAARANGLERRSRLLPFNFLNLGEMMTLGGDDATISTLGGKVELSGPAASWLRRWIYAARMPTARQGVFAAADGTGRRLARGGAAGRRRKKSKPVDWK